MNRSDSDSERLDLGGQGKSLSSGRIATVELPKMMAELQQCLVSAGA